MGCNLLRVWGGAVLESSHFYDACDRLGLMVWQELPLSSSGIDNWPPEDQKTIEDLVSIARSYIIRRKHHVSLLMYCGGNELQGNLDGEKEGTGKPVDFSHPMMSRLKELFEELDGARRFIPTSPFGPRFNADMEDFGKGIHWSIHGPWNVDGVLDDRWSRYWDNDDALLRAETGCPGTMDLERLKTYVPSLNVLPIAQSNPVWGRTSWWIESDVFEQEFGRLPENAAEYFEWSQKRQAKALRIAATATKRRFPACGGIIIWMGHDCYPCAANTSVIDVDAVPKPAYYALKQVFTTPREVLDVQ
jgi:beta-mannosidase